MTKQEEIREGIYELIADALARMSLDTGVGLNELIAEIQKFEVSKGVVIKVGEVSDICSCFHSDKCYGACMSDVAVEELI